MKVPRLTNRFPAATRSLVRTEQETGRSRQGALVAAAMLLGSAAALSGCISVNAPDKPIVIELNINIKQEIIYRLAEDVKENIQANPEIF